MLKIIPPTTSCGCGYFKSKCAEIHYQTASFSILCIFCGMNALSWNDFLDHFNLLHFEDFAKSMECTAEPAITTILEHSDEVNKSIQYDPLAVDKEPDEIMKRLENQLKTEGSDRLISQVEDDDKEFTDNESVNTRNKAISNEFNESDEELLVCKVKVEQCDLQATKPTRPREMRHCLKNHLKNESLVEAESNACQQDQIEYVDDRLQTITEVSGSESSDDENNIDTCSDNNGSIFPPTPSVVAEDPDIDWTKPYAPNLLKNHEKRPYKKRNKPNICTYCGRIFRRRYQLDTHLNIHTGLKPHQCEICGRQFRAVTTLTRHLNTHESREAYQCKFCTKSFTHKAALLSHELRHTQERSIPCNECEKLFYTVNQMDTHTRKVHHKDDDDANNALPFACDLCAKRYRSASMLSTHKFKKHYKTAKFACEQCGKKFINATQLETHKLIHVDRQSVTATASLTQ